jgi:hypothetical protein
MSQMRSTTLRMLWAVLIVWVVLGCDTAPQSSPGPGGSAAPTSSAPAPSATTAPSGTPPATNPAPALRLVRVSTPEGFVDDAAHGEPGWVTVGVKDPNTPSALARYSVDGEQWQTGTVRGESFDLTRVTWGNGAYFGVGTRCNSEAHPQYCDFDGVTWRSTDGRTWKRIGGAGLEDVGYIAGPLAAGVDGALVLGWVSAARHRSGVYWSRDGSTWARVDPAEFGADANFADRVDVVGTAAGFVLIGAGCLDCPARAYTSRDGRHWDLDGELDLADIQGVSLATDGSRILVSIVTCGDSGPCRTEIRSSVAGGPWAHSAAPEAVGSPLLTYARTAYVLLADNDKAYLSRDGESWSELTLDYGGDPALVRSGYGAGTRCDIEFIAGGDGDIVLGAEQCGAWRAVLP